jgi:hypothetical protein
VGCLHAVLRFYEKQGYMLALKNLTEDGEYRYLTSPAGNPNNYSFVLAKGPDGRFEIRQQVRIESHVNEAIRFTPDIVVLRKAANILQGALNPDFASGKRQFFTVDSKYVVAAHECKSLNPFPELLVSFLGMLIAAHKWYPKNTGVRLTNDEGHLGPTLFVGGTPRALHQKMISAMQSSYPINIIAGLHKGTWSLTDAKNRIVWKGRRRTVPRKIRADLPF